MFNKHWIILISLYLFSSIKKTLSFSNSLDDGDGGIGLIDYFDILFSDEDNGNDAQGSAVVMDTNFGIAAVGAPNTNANNKERDGVVYVFQRILGTWSQLEMLQAPPPAVQNGMFGVSLSLTTISGNLTLLVGSPGRNTVYVYIYIQDSEAFLLDATLTVPYLKVGDGFGGPNTISSSNMFAVIGAPELRTAFIFSRLENGWDNGTIIKASDADSTKYADQIYGRKDYFGSSVGISGRLIIIGCPSVNGGKDVAGMSISPGRPRYNNMIDKGSIYIFTISPQVQQILLHVDYAITDGTFMLELNGTSEYSKLLPFDVTAAEMKASLEELQSIDQVNVTREGSPEIGYAWNITFISEPENLPILLPLWKGYGCNPCIELSVPYSSNPSLQMESAELFSIGNWTEHTKLQSPDRDISGGFGQSVAIDGKTIVVGDSSLSQQSTTWDFETGDLRGWKKTGNAFDNQPTFGDNTYSRILYDPSFALTAANAERSNHDGVYWIGTLERHPPTSQNYSSNCGRFGICTDRYRTFLSPYPWGDTQGNEPLGTLTSSPFLIKGQLITFKIGGGCDDSSVYIELLIDGKSVKRTTGSCRERMERRRWHVKRYLHRIAQIRIVDNSQGPWGHINVDSIRFDWKFQSSDIDRSGSSYVYHLQQSIEKECTTHNMIDCEWILEGILKPSDSMTGDGFGYSVSVHEEDGIIAVGSPFTQPNSEDQVPVGAVYLFRRRNELMDIKETIRMPTTWTSYEVAKLNPPNETSCEKYGIDLSLSNPMLLIGSSFHDHLLNSTGAGYLYNLHPLFTRFNVSEYSVVENFPGYALVTVIRTEHIDTSVSIGYITSDIQAKGVDEETFNNCSITPFDGCGNYQQTSGILTFASGDTSKTLQIPILDDECYDSQPKYFSLQLYIPGGTPLVGADYSTLIRIDENDFNATRCSNYSSNPDPNINEKNDHQWD